MSEQQVNLDELWVISYILMGAAFADGEFDGNEAETIIDIVDELLGDQETPDDLKPHLEAFDHTTFNLETAAKQLHLKGATDRAALLRLVARVTEADDLHDLRESDYIRRLGQAIGAAPKEYKGMTVELTWISSLD